jgi:hypothetical protein
MLGSPFFVVLTIIKGRDAWPIPQTTAASHKTLHRALRLSWSRKQGCFDARLDPTACDAQQEHYVPIKVQKSACSVDGKPPREINSCEIIACARFGDIGPGVERAVGARRSDCSRPSAVWGLQQLREVIG